MVDFESEGSILSEWIGHWIWIYSRLDQIRWFDQKDKQIEGALYVHMIWVTSYNLIQAWIYIV